MAEKLKYEILKLSSKSESISAPQKRSRNGGKTDYWRYIIFAESIDIPDKKEKKYRDYLWLRVKLGLNYKKELNKFDHGTGSKNAKHTLKLILREQLALHLGLNHYIKIHDIYQEAFLIIGISMEFNFLLATFIWPRQLMEDS